MGLEPLVVRIGAYKSAGDTLARQNSTEEFRLVQETLVTQVRWMVGWMVGQRKKGMRRH